MLELHLDPKYGNAGGRFFPHRGHLGVTPVSIQGTVRTKLPELCQPLPVKAVTVTVRCLESRSTGVFGVDSDNVLWEKTKQLWQPSSGGEFEDMGDWDAGFSISVPVDAVQRACSSQFLKEWKVVWKLDVTIEHRPIPYVGNRITKTYGLNLVNFRNPQLQPLSPPSPMTVPGAQVQISPPHGSYGPDDTFAVTLNVKPDDPSMQLKKAIVVLERTIEFLETVSKESSRGRDAGPDSARPSTAPAAPVASPSRFTSLFRRSVSPRPPIRRVSNDTPSPELAPCAISIETRDIDEQACDEPALSPGGVYSCSIPLSIPKRGGKWDTGETVRTDLVNISFSLRAKIVLKPANSSKRSLVKEYTLPSQPVILVGASQAERAAAHSSAAAVAAMAPKSLSKRRHHRSSRRGLYLHEGTTDIADPVVRNVHTSSPTSHRRRRTRSETPDLLPILGIASPSDVKPILLTDDSGHTATAQSISFVFPSPAPIRGTGLPTPPADSPQEWSRSPPSLHQQQQQSHTLPPISSLLQQAHPYESASILKQFQQTGRRISTTTSEEDEIQPSRTRLRYDPVEASGSTTFSVQADVGGVPGRLPSLSALGFGLPQIPDEERPARRPRTAPVHSAFAMRGHIPPPLSGDISTAAVLPSSSEAGAAAHHAGQRPTTSFMRPSTSMGRIKGQMGFQPPRAAASSEGEGAFAFVLSPGHSSQPIEEGKE